MRGITVSLLFALLLTGCAAPVEEEAARAASAPRSSAPQEDTMQAALVESAARPLLEAEILAAYEQALRVYGWFDLSPLPSMEETAVYEGKVYRRVNMDGIQKIEDLRAYLRSVFSRDLTARLLDGESCRIQYRDIDGALYVCGERRSRVSGKGRFQIEPEQLDDTSYSVNILVDLLDEDGKTVVGLESWSFPYAYEDDRWVFTDFRLIY